MRAPNSPRPLRAASCSLFVLVISSIVLPIIFLAGPASTRSVARHDEVKVTDDAVIDEKLDPKTHGNVDVAPEIKENDFSESHGISKRDSVEKEHPESEISAQATEIATPIEEQAVIGKSSISSELKGAKIGEGIVKSKEDEGIRRFDAVIGNEEAAEKVSGKEEKERVEKSEIGKTVIKGIIVKDAPIDSDSEPEIVPEVYELSGIKVNRKRSLADSELAGEPVATAEGEPSVAKETVETVNDAGDETLDSAKLREVPVLIPVGSSHAKLKRAEKISTAEVSTVQEKENLADLPTAKEAIVEAVAEVVKEEIGRSIPELTQAHEKPVAQDLNSDESVNKEAIVVPETPEVKKVIVDKVELGQVADDLEIGNEEVLIARKSLPISEDDENDEESEERVVRSEEASVLGEELSKSALGEELPKSVPGEELPKSVPGEELPKSVPGEELPKSVIGEELPKSVLGEELPTSVLGEELPTSVLGEELPKSVEIGESTKNKEISEPVARKESYSPSLFSVIKTNDSLDHLKAQAISLQREIKDKDYLQRLKEQATEILPGIPQFTEIQLLEALKEIASSKKSDEDLESSYLSKVYSVALNASQMQILKYTEALVARDQRQTFVENIMECIRGFSILNCMRIFVFPIIVDNIPESFTQNLPTLPIEINISDLLPGNQQDKPKAAQLNSTSRQHQKRLITPEVVVSGILKDALNADPSKITDSEVSFIDPQNETLSKWLTPGQLEILKMAEKFLPESSRQEYANKMSSCVRRFEYFSCVKYFAWRMVKQHYSALPEFPDYQSWYPSVTLYPGYPILPYPNTEGIGELPEVVEADSTRTRRPRPEAVIVQILENTLRQVPGYPNYQTYQARQPTPVFAPVTQEQMAIFYTAEQLIPAQLRADYMAKTMRCIRDYDYLTCTKYSTWPTVRQWFPNLPAFPDFSSFIPTFTIPELPDFSQYIPDFGSLIPNFPTIPGFPGTSTPKPDPAPQPQPQPIPDKPPQEQNSTILSREEERVAEPTSPLENRIIQILSNIRWMPPDRNVPQLSSITPESLAVIKTLTYNQLRILGMSKNAIPALVRGDLDSRFIGCLQGGINFINCTRNVIWPTLLLYVRNMPIFPDNEAIASTQKISEASYGASAIKPGVYQPIANSAEGLQAIFLENADQIAARSPTGGQIVAESEESAIPAFQPQEGTQISRDDESVQDPTVSLRQSITGKSSDPSIPVISVTDTRFTPLYSDHPETVLLNILTTIQSSSKYADKTYAVEKPGYLESLNDYLNADQRSVIRVSENLLPEELRSDFMERLKGCVAKSSFIVCSRDIIWPSLSQYYQRLPSFPNFYINDYAEKIGAGGFGVTESVGPVAAAISETDVKTGQHGDAMVTITDTRFVPIFSQHPEAVILTILRNVQAASPNLVAQPGATKTATRTTEFLATFTDQQGNIVTVAENLLPESIREVFTKRMSECVKENSFLACTRDIAWPTIAQFFPRLPNFPNIGALPDFAIEKPQQPALLPPQLEPAKPSLTPESPSIAMPTENLVPITPEDVESKIEDTLKQISMPSNSVQEKFSFLNTKDPMVASFITERQANVIRLTEDMLPDTIKPIFVRSMVDCARIDAFPNCVRNICWPTLRQYVSNIPEFPNFGNYFPQVPQEIPQFPDYQIPQIPQIPQLRQIPQISNIPGYQPQSFGYTFRAAQDKIGQEATIISTAQHQPQPGGVLVPGIQGLTPSVDSAAAAIDPGSAGFPGLSPPVVSGLPGGSADLLSEVPSERRRKRRHIGEEPLAIYQDISSNNFDPQLPPNITESELLRILVNITKKKNAGEAQDPEEYIVEGLNSSLRDSLTTEQLAILKIVEDISSQTARGFMSKVIQCIRGLSFIRCMGIFVWPVITQNLPSLPTLGSLNPFGRSSEVKETFEDIFGMSSKEFEMELLERKENVEKILIDWYREVVEKKYDNDYGFLRVQGYGDGEIGISFNGFKRKGRGAKIKDSKNMPSILTIISDIMEDMLDQRDWKTEKKEHGKRDRSLREEDDYNRVFSDHEIHRDSERSSNDDQIIAMFLDKIRVNGTGDIGESGGSDGGHYLTVEDAYEAFELLFGTRLSERMAEKFHNVDKNHYRTLNDERSSDFSKRFQKTFAKSSEHSRASSKITTVSEENEKKVGSDETKKREEIRSGLILRLPKIDEELVSRKITNGFADLARKMKMQMSQIAPGISFLISFFVQMALAHARAAASVAGMMSNMALGSAFLSMIRQTFFGSMSHPKIKHVYDNAPMGPGITWPAHNYHY